APALEPSGDLGLRGGDDARDDAGAAGGGAGAALGAARGGSDRPLVRDVTVLVSACGAPGTAALLRALRENGERQVRLVGTDMSDRAVGRHLCDAFHLVPPGSEPEFVAAILEIVEMEHVDAVLPQSSFDLERLAEHRDEFD